LHKRSDYVRVASLKRATVSGGVLHRLSRFVVSDERDAI
jgi:hypothetical protein